jgi:hypothetical protein
MIPKSGNRFSEKIMPQAISSRPAQHRSTAARACKTQEKPTRDHCAVRQYLLRAQPRALAQFA